MIVQDNFSWESRLLNLAHEGLEKLSVPVDPIFNNGLLTNAYRTCEAITKKNSRTFMLASGFLPWEKRRAIRALYAFCRISDDIVDRGQTPDPENALADWRYRSLASRPPSGDLVAVAWADARRKFGIPIAYAEQLLEGVATDLLQSRFQTFDELAGYAYKVASTVGLMSMHIIGFSGLEAIPYAVKLGVALQLTNILRDVGEDWRKGRLYLPLQELVQFGLSEADVAAGKVTSRWRRFMRFQIQRVHRLYEEAWPGIAMLNPDGRFSIAAAAGLYEAILDDIERHDYDVFSHRASLSTIGKILHLPSILIRMQTPADQSIWYDDEIQTQAGQ
jgi:15-cis-phytoene synthase